MPHNRSADRSHQKIDTKIDTEEIQKLAELSKLQLSSAEIEELKKDLNQFLNHVEVLKTVDTEKISPTTQVLNLKNVTRRDEKKESVDSNLILDIAPAHHNHFFVVPQVIPS